MSFRALVSLVLTLAAIVVCGGLGAIAGYGVMKAIGADGAFGAIVAALVAMPVATAAWAAGSVALRAARLIR